MLYNDSPMFFIFRKIILLLVIALSFSTGFYLGSGGDDLKNVSVVQNVSTSTVAVIINSGLKATEVLPKVELVTGDTLFAVLERGLRKKGIEFSYKDYGGSMGVFITTIASTTNSSDKWWQYYVNGQYGNAGASTFKPLSGDVIEFKLTGEMPK